MAGTDCRGRRHLAGSRRWPSSRTSPGRWTAGSRPWPCSSTTPRPAAGRRGRLFTSHDRAGEATISSRLGLARPAVEVRPGFDFWIYTVGELTGGRAGRLPDLRRDAVLHRRPDRPARPGRRRAGHRRLRLRHPDRLPDPAVPRVAATGRAVRHASRCSQVRALCWCGRRATHNARTVDGDDGRRRATRSSSATPTGPRRPSAEVAYEVLCRRHHRRRMTRARRRGRRCDPLPFDRVDRTSVE